MQGFFYILDEDNLISESKVCLDEDRRSAVLSGSLKGMEGHIKKFNRKRGCLAVEF